MGVMLQLSVSWRLNSLEKTEHREYQYTLLCSVGCFSLGGPNSGQQKSIQQQIARILRQSCTGVFVRVIGMNHQGRHSIQICAFEKSTLTYSTVNG